VDHCTIDPSIDEAIADPACELAESRLVGDPHFRLKDEWTSWEVTTLVVLSAGARAADGQCPGGRDGTLIPISVVLLRGRRNGRLLGALEKGRSL